MSTGNYILRTLTVALFVVAVCAPILRQLVDSASSVQIQLVEELPEEEKEQDNKDNEQKLKDKKFCSDFLEVANYMAQMSFCHSATLLHSADHSSMPDPPPEIV